MQSARDEILGKLTKAVHPLPEEPDKKEKVFYDLEGPLEETFKNSLEKVNGEVHFFESKKELYRSLKKFLSVFKKKNIVCREPELLDQLNAFGIGISEVTNIPDSMDVGITGCEFLIAHTGSIMVSSAQEGGRQLFVYPPVHLVIAREDQVVDYLESAYSGIRKKYGKDLPSQITLITGPSRTADIEKTLILGAHGPRQLHVFLYGGN